MLHTHGVTIGNNAILTIKSRNPANVNVANGATINAAAAGNGELVVYNGEIATTKLGGIGNISKVTIGDGTNGDSLGILALPNAFGYDIEANTLHLVSQGANHNHILINDKLKVNEITGTAGSTLVVNTHTDVGFNIGADGSPVNITFTGANAQTLRFNTANKTIYANITKNPGAMGFAFITNTQDDITIHGTIGSADPKQEFNAYKSCYQ
jgi:hypothetical protein